MFNWAKQQLANVAGTAEPEYGPSAIQSVAAQDTPFTELKKEDMKWFVMDSTCVETQTFYFTADSGHVGLAQVIYSNVAGIRVTCQFNTKIFYPDRNTPNLWSSDPLSDYGFDEEKYNFHAQGCSITLSEDGKSYHIKSSTNTRSVVDLTFSTLSPGFVVGKDGTSSFGTDPKAPWGKMRHSFWPRCKVEGSIITQQGPIDLQGRGMFIHALQGMKPHHAAARWTFGNFQSPTYSAIMMEYTTPPSYGNTVVNVGGIAVDGKILYAGPTNTVKHTASHEDPECGWPAPDAMAFKWSSADGAVEAELSGEMGERWDRVDIMAEVPKFVKQIVAGAAGTKPYIYQYGPKLETFRIKVDGEEKSEAGQLFTEATFIS
ncbi:hypothetical protein AAFC00_006847 [Neodothiora populina]|uniref:Survival factor 1 n=1 Tax=Neodothiora populina TaxID=2781224 RepID=A0ABR3PBC3_9PEZI